MYDIYDWCNLRLVNPKSFTLQEVSGNLDVAFAHATACHQVEFTPFRGDVLYQENSPDAAFAHTTRVNSNS